MSKHIFLTIVIAALVSFGTYKLTSDHDHAIRKETAYERILRTGTLRCGYGIWPPVMLMKDANTGKISGVLVDITKEMAKALNLKVEWIEETGWAEWAEALKAHRFDVF